MQGLALKFPANENISYLLQHNITLNFVLRDYVADAYEQLPEQEFYKHLMGLLGGVVFFYQKYQRISDMEKRVIVFHADVDEVIAKNLFGENAVGAKILCSRGCSGCCSQLVSVSQTEAELLLNSGATVNVEQLSKQHMLTTENWTDHLTEQEGQCVFLNSTDGSCNVWEARPANCRNYFMTGSSQHCSVFKRNPDLSRSIKSVYADVCISAFYALDGGESSLSKYLYEKLS